MLDTSKLPNVHHDAAADDPNECHRVEVPHDKHMGSQQLHHGVGSLPVVPRRVFAFESQVCVSSGHTPLPNVGDSALSIPPTPACRDMKLAGQKHTAVHVEGSGAMTTPHPNLYLWKVSIVHTCVQACNLQAGHAHVMCIQLVLGRVRFH